MYSLLLDKKVVIFRKNGFRHEGKLINFDEKFIVVDDIRSGLSYVAISEVEKVSEVKAW